MKTNLLNISLFVLLSPVSLCGCSNAFTMSPTRWVEMTDAIQQMQVLEDVNKKYPELSDIGGKQ